jgi:predicted ATPase
MRRLTYHPNYQPTYVGFDKSKTNLFMEGVFHTDDGDKRVVLENNWDDKVGLTVDELPVEIISAASFIDADKPSSMHSFQISAENKDGFLDIVESVYNLKCYLPQESMVSEYDPQEGKRINFYTDFVITKRGRDLVHYKSFSDGEKKIATLIAALFRKSKETDILLVDNIELHIYFKRHMTLIKKLEEFFPNHQFIATTHSPIIVSEMDKKYLHDMEKNIL